MSKRFLIIDDSPYDRELIKRAIGKIFSEVSYVEVIHQRALEEALRTLDYAVVFIDYQLKWGTGTQILKAIRARSASLPVIMVTDTGCEEIAVEAMKEGLNDYVLKRHLQRLPFAIKDCLERVELQAQMQQAQKMESLGLLVSGITHDFNNLLTAITGIAQLGMTRTQQEASPFHNYFQQIHCSAEQGARMTRQLLTFARGTPMEPKYLNLNKQIGALMNLLQTLTDSRVQVNFTADPHLKHIYADATQLDQVLFNLCLNACDAMPMGGNLELVTEQIEIAQTETHSHPYLQSGSYVVVRVKDSGIGMDEQTQARLFEPFFTTKEVGKGTGLGLAMVYGIVKQHQGIIQVQSQPGLGSTFSLYFPAIESRTDMEPAPLKDSAIACGGETLLLVEDDLGIQEVMGEVLQECGYTVMVAKDGEEGLSIFEAHASSIALVIADIMMPKMKGRQFQEQVRRQRPDTKVLIISGYGEMDLKRRDLLDPRSAFLQKPFDLDVLVAKVRGLLSLDSPSNLQE
jgi:two-component system, cell cycle sensor histidine kinase and response regulator CckA